MDVERINSYSPAELAESSAFVADFYKELDEIDLAILKLKIEGKSLEEIADILGFRTHSAVHKRIKRIQQQYLDFDPDSERNIIKNIKIKKFHKSGTFLILVFPLLYRERKYIILYMIYLIASGYISHLRYKPTSISLLKLLL